MSLLSELWILAVFCLIAYSFILHELAHGYVAYMFGDETAKNQNRLTFNPFSHLASWRKPSPLQLQHVPAPPALIKSAQAISMITGMIFLPFLLMWQSLPVFGWANAVPVDYTRLKFLPKIAVLFAGILANFLIGVLCAVAIRCFMFIGIHSWELYISLIVLSSANFFLCIVHLIPMPPFDGSKIILLLFSKEYREIVTFYLNALSFVFALISVLILLKTNVVELVYPIIGKIIYFFAFS